MKILNLKAVGSKILNFFTNLYDICLNRIAFNSKLYKNLYNRYKLIEELKINLFDFVKIMEASTTTNLLTKLYNTSSSSILRKFDYQVVRLSEPHDIIVVASELEKQRIKNDIQNIAGGEVITIEELLLKQIPANCSIYIFSSVWIKEQTKLVNLLYKINSNKEKYSL